LGIDPHWVLWKFLFCLHPSGSFTEIPELGGAIVSVQSESHYLEFKMAQSVQGWRQNGSISRTRNLLTLISMGLLPLMRARV
jgi:hypothetical protein